MKLTRGLLALAFNFSLIFPSILILQPLAAHAQTTNSAIQRGYRTGYSDGYMAGYRDSIDSLERSLARHREFDTADRAYSKEYGALEDYRDGYKQGFQSGYNTGFEKRTFESSVPANLQPKGLTAPEPAKAVAKQADSIPVDDVPLSSADSSAQNSTKVSDLTTTPIATNDISMAQSTTIQRVSFSPDDSVITIPKDVEIILELQEDVTTAVTREGERFSAKVVSPMELDGAIVEGHVEKLQIPGRIKRKAELQLSFDRIVINDTRWSNFNGVLTEVMPVKGDNVRRITNEGTAVGQSSIKGDAIKISVSTGTGAGVGAIFGGPVGLAVGASVGAAFGIGSALVDRGKHIRLNKNQQLKVRSTYDTQIR